MTLDFHKSIRDRLGEYGDLYMRLRGYYWAGPKGTTEPEFGYRTFLDYVVPIQVEAADALANIVSSSTLCIGSQVIDLYGNHGVVVKIDATNDLVTVWMDAAADYCEQYELSTWENSFRLA